MYQNTRQDFQFKTIIYEEELNRIAAWVEEYPDLETGGDLFGFWTHTGAPVVQFVLGPGKKSRHNVASFYQDGDHLINAGQILREKHGLQHIGEWHSHHQLGLAEPSGGDANTVCAVLTECDFPRFLLCIANLRNDSENFRKQKVSVGCFLFNQSIRHYKTGAWVILPGESPIRTTLKYERIDDSYKTSKNWNVAQTTLDSQVLKHSQPIEVSESLWYGKPDGLALLRNIDTDLKYKFQNYQMSRDVGTEKISFAFIKNGDNWQIELPHDFPNSTPRFKVNGKGFYDVIWMPDSKLIDVIQNCFDLYEKKGDR